jgi:hypothetical protein
MIAYEMNETLLAMPSHLSRRIDVTEKLDNTKLPAK